MPLHLRRLGNSLPFSKLFRKLGQDIETVINVLQPGPLGIVEHKFSADEICQANAIVKRAVENWRKKAKVERSSPIFKDYINE